MPIWMLCAPASGVLGSAGAGIVECPGPLPAGRGQLVAVASVALIVPGYQGQALTLSGPEPLTPGEQVAALARTLQRPLHYEPLSDDEARAGMAGRGSQAGMAAGSQTISVTSRAGAASQPPPGTAVAPRAGGRGGCAPRARKWPAARRRTGRLPKVAMGR